MRLPLAAVRSVGITSLRSLQEMTANPWSKASRLRLFDPQSHLIKYLRGLLPVPVGSASCSYCGGDGNNPYEMGCRVGRMGTGLSLESVLF